MIKYFAYGSNMTIKTISKVCPSYKLLGPARLKDFRLAFTRFSNKFNGGGVADILQAPDLFVWGILYEVDENDVKNLDQKEDLGKAYNRINVNVTLQNGTTHQAITYAVISKAHYEIRPNIKYLDLLLQGAKENNLKKSYINFLESLLVDENRWSKKGFLVFPTESRKKAGGLNLIKVSSSVSKKLGLGPLAVVAYGSKICLGKVIQLNSIGKNACQIDETIRTVIGFPGREHYGVYISLFPVKRKEFAFPFVKPRSLTLSINRPSIYHSEKKICVLHEDNIRLLGLHEGEYVKIYVAILGRKGKYRIGKCTRRTFTGSSRELQIEGNSVHYPIINNIYIDLDGRLALGLPKDATDIPAVISANVWRLFTSRLLYYGIILFLGLAALTPIVREILGKLNKVGIALALLISAALTLLLCIFDVRGRVQY